MMREAGGAGPVADDIESARAPASHDMRAEGADPDP